MIQLIAHMKDGTNIEFTKESGWDFASDKVSWISQKYDDPESEQAWALAEKDLAEMRAFLRHNEAFLTGYQTDFDVIDTIWMAFHPGKPFVWVVREYGTHLYILDSNYTSSDTGKVSKAGKEFTEMMDYFVRGHAGNAVCLMKLPGDERMRMTTFAYAKQEGRKLFNTI